MLAAEPPPVVAPAPAPAAEPAEVVIVSRDAHSDILESRDTPLALVKGRRTEDALLRQTIFMTSTLTVVRPASGPGEETLRWTYEPYLQHQLCFTSMTGVFSCAAVEVEELKEKSAGETPLPATPDPAPSSRAESGQDAPAEAAPGQAAPTPNPVAEAARVAVAAALHARADALFDDDRRLKLDPMLKAAGVSIRRPGAPARPVRR